MSKREELAIVTDFGERYRARELAAAAATERAALGTSCGANGYTTLEQANLLAERLPLGTTSRVLDLGCGCGWPGLHLAGRFACRVVGIDLPLEGLRRARASGLERRADAVWVRSSARSIPFRPGSFDAIVHADVMC